MGRGGGSVRRGASRLRRRRYKRLSKEKEVQTVREGENRTSLRRRYLVVGFLSVLGGCVVTAFLTWHVAAPRPRPEPPDPLEPLPPSWSFQHSFRRAAVCTDGSPCSRIGRDILARNGSAVDAAVAALFCNGVVNMQSMGLGGGFLMTVYERRSGTAYALLARESAPAAATRDMFSQRHNLSRDGVLGAGVPGELRGYWEAHRRFGRLPWGEVVAPSLQLCRDGYHMTKHQRDSLTFRERFTKEDPVFREWFVDKATGNFKPAGSLIRPHVLCETLAVVAREGGDAMHNGSLTQAFVDDVQQLGGIITEEDMNNYKPVWQEPISVKLKDHKLYTSPPPGCGALLAFILNVLQGYNMSQESVSNVANLTLTVHRMVEAFKHAYARRSLLGDPAFVNMTEEIERLTSGEFAGLIRGMISDGGTVGDPRHYGPSLSLAEDHGTAHISLLAPDGDAVSVTSTVNLYFGAGVTSRRTGIILNSGMNDFSFPGVANYFGVPPSPANFIAPGKRALSSMSPSIVTDRNGDVSLVIGASGGTKITTSVSFAIMRFLWMNNSIKEAVDASRFHHQLHPNEIQYEYGAVAPLIQNLRSLGHTVVRYKDRGSIICAIGKRDNTIYANADYRKGGEVYGLD